MKLTSRQLLIIVAAIVVVAAAAIYFISRPRDVITAGGGTVTADTSALMVAGPLGETAIGDANAPNVVIEYASLTCPHCQRFHADVWQPFKEKYVDTGKVRFIMRNYSLNVLDTAAIMLTRCAPADRYFALVDLLYDRQQEWAFVADPKAALLNVLKQAGYTEESFTACLKNQSVLDGVEWVKQRATKEFGVESTPTFFVNGQKMIGEQTLADLDKVLGG